MDAPSAVGTAVVAPVEPPNNMEDADMESLTDAVAAVTMVTAMAE
jgi:hypothetical protein